MRKNGKARKGTLSAIEGTDGAVTYVPRTSLRMYLSSTVGTLAFFLSESFGDVEALAGFFFPNRGIFQNNFKTDFEKKLFKDKNQRLFTSFKNAADCIGRLLN